jgi:hypothetical protein
MSENIRSVVCPSLFNAVFLTSKVSDVEWIGKEVTMTYFKAATITALGIRHRGPRFCEISGSYSGEYENDSLPCSLVEIDRRFRGA